MPLTKLATIRYQALDACFSDYSRYYFIEDLLDAVNRALRNNDCTPISKRTVQYDICAMEGNCDWNIIFEEPGKINGRRYYRYADSSYSIWTRDLSESELSQLESIMLMLEQFRGLPQFERMQNVLNQLKDKYGLELPDTTTIIDFDTNDYVQGLEYLSPVFNAIVHKQVLNITYQPFGKVARSIILHPYYIKQYNSRWFVLGRCTSYKELSILALDRIVSIKSSTSKYIENTNVDFAEYFADVIGVTVDESIPIEKVILRFAPNRIPYVLSNPLHESQNNCRKAENIIELHVRPNRELMQKILSFGGDVEVIEPASLREQIRTEINRMLHNY